MPNAHIEPEKGQQQHQQLQPDEITTKEVEFEVKQNVSAVSIDLTGLRRNSNINNSDSKVEKAGDIAKGKDSDSNNAYHDQSASESKENKHEDEACNNQTVPAVREMGAAYKGSIAGLQPLPSLTPSSQSHSQSQSQIFNQNQIEQMQTPSIPPIDPATLNIIRSERLSPSVIASGVYGDGNGDGHGDEDWKQAGPGNPKIRGSNAGIGDCQTQVLNKVGVNNNQSPAPMKPRPTANESVDFHDLHGKKEYQIDDVYVAPTIENVSENIKPPTTLSPVLHFQKAPPGGPNVYNANASVKYEVVDKDQKARDSSNYRPGKHSILLSSSSSTDNMMPLLPPSVESSLLAGNINIGRQNSSDHHHQNYAMQHQNGDRDATARASRETTGTGVLDHEKADPDAAVDKDKKGKKKQKRVLTQEEIVQLVEKMNNKGDDVSVTSSMYHAVLAQLAANSSGATATDVADLDMINSSSGSPKDQDNNSGQQAQHSLSRMGTQLQQIPEDGQIKLHNAGTEQQKNDTDEKIVNNLNRKSSHYRDSQGKSITEDQYYRNLIEKSLRGQYLPETGPHVAHSPGNDEASASITGVDGTLNIPNDLKQMQKSSQKSKTVVSAGGLMVSSVGVSIRDQQGAGEGEQEQQGNSRNYHVSLADMPNSGMPSANNSVLGGSAKKAKLQSATSTTSPDKNQNNSRQQKKQEEELQINNDATSKRQFWQATPDKQQDENEQPAGLGKYKQDKQMKPNGRQASTSDGSTPGRSPLKTDSSPLSGISDDNGSSVQKNKQNQMKEISNEQQSQNNEKPVVIEAQFGKKSEIPQQNEQTQRQLQFQRDTRYFSMRDPSIHVPMPSDMEKDSTRFASNYASSPRTAARIRQAVQQQLQLQQEQQERERINNSQMSLTLTGSFGGGNNKKKSRTSTPASSGKKSQTSSSKSTPAKQHEQDTSVNVGGLETINEVKPMEKDYATVRFSESRLKGKTSSLYNNFGQGPMQLQSMPATVGGQIGNSQYGSSDEKDFNGFSRSNKSNDLANENHHSKNYNNQNSMQNHRQQSSDDVQVRQHPMHTMSVPTQAMSKSQAFIDNSAIRRTAMPTQSISTTNMHSHNHMPQSINSTMSYSNNLLDQQGQIQMQAKGNKPKQQPAMKKVTYFNERGSVLFEDTEVLEKIIEDGNNNCYLSRPTSVPPSMSLTKRNSVNGRNQNQSQSQGYRGNQGQASHLNGSSSNLNSMMLDVQPQSVIYEDEEQHQQMHAQQNIDADNQLQQQSKRNSSAQQTQSGKQSLQTSPFQPQLHEQNSNQYQQYPQSAERQHDHEPVDIDFSTSSSNNSRLQNQMQNSGNRGKTRTSRRSKSLHSRHEASQSQVQGISMHQSRNNSQLQQSPYVVNQSQSRISDANANGSARKYQQDQSARNSRRSISINNNNSISNANISKNINNTTEQPSIHRIKMETEVKQPTVQYPGPLEPLKTEDYLDPSEKVIKVVDYGPETTHTNPNSNRHDDSRGTHTDPDISGFHRNKLQQQNQSPLTQNLQQHIANQLQNQFPQGQGLHQHQHQDFDENSQIQNASRLSLGGNSSDKTVEPQFWGQHSEVALQLGGNNNTNCNSSQANCDHSSQLVKRQSRRHNFDQDGESQNMNMNVCYAQKQNGHDETDTHVNNGGVSGNLQQQQTNHYVSDRSQNVSRVLRVDSGGQVSSRSGAEKGNSNSNSSNNNQRSKSKSDTENASLSHRSSKLNYQQNPKTLPIRVSLPCGTKTALEEAIRMNNSLANDAGGNNNKQQSGSVLGAYQLKNRSEQPQINQRPNINNYNANTSSSDDVDSSFQQRPKQNHYSTRSPPGLSSSHQQKEVGSGQKMSNSNKKLKVKHKIHHHHHYKVGDKIELPNGEFSRDGVHHHHVHHDHRNVNISKDKMTIDTVVSAAVGGG